METSTVIDAVVDQVIALDHLVMTGTVMFTMIMDPITTILPAYRERSRSPEARPQQDQSGQSANRDSRRTSSASFSPHGNSRNRYA